jgi:hypothetical protein
VKQGAFDVAADVHPEKLLVFASGAFLVDRVLADNILDGPGVRGVDNTTLADFEAYYQLHGTLDYASIIADLTMHTMQGLEEYDDPPIEDTVDALPCPPGNKMYTEYLLDGTAFITNIARIVGVPHQTNPEYVYNESRVQLEKHMLMLTDAIKELHGIPADENVHARGVQDGFVSFNRTTINRVQRTPHAGEHKRKRRH